VENKKRVLVIDDNRTLVLAARGVLQKNGYDVITALNGSEGLQKAEQEKPDVIVLDIVMPGMNGYEVGQELKQNPETSDIPIIFLSAKGNTDEKKGPTANGLKEIDKAFECGANDFLNKPVKADDLLASIKNVLWFAKMPFTG